MSRHDWYRNTDWNSEIESAFRAKLSRSRSQRPQYLQIQASQLADTFPDISLALTGEYFETGDGLFVSSAFCSQARAYCAISRLDQAISAYKRALEWEQTHPNLITTARFDFPKLVADNRLVTEYECAIDILTTRFKVSDHQIPINRYFWNGICALITYDRGEVTEAKEFAARALRAAAETESPFRYHRSLGVVKSISDEFGQRIQRIARPSKLQSIFRLIRIGKG